MKVGLIWDADYPWDVRIEKVAKALVDKGHEVHLICRNTAMKETYEIVGCLNVHRLPVVTKFSASINEIVSFPAFFNPIWFCAINSVIKRQNIGYLIVRDLPLCPTAIWLSKLHGIPCAMDMAESYPELLRCIWKFEKPKIRNVFLRNPFFAELVEKYCIKRLDRILVMIEESRARLIDLNVPPERISIVSNTPYLDLIKPNEKRNDEKSSLMLLYLGILNPSRGLETVIDGILELKKRDVSCHLKIAGTGKAREDLEYHVKKLGLDDRVTFLGWVDRTTIESLFKNIDVGVVPHHVCSHWDTTIPNKLFDYMAAGIPVLSTDVKPMSRIINDVGCGIIYRDFDVSSFANSVISLLDAEKRLKMGINGHKAVISRFNWDRDSSFLVNDTVG